MASACIRPMASDSLPPLPHHPQPFQDRAAEEVGGQERLTVQPFCAAGMEKGPIPAIMSTIVSVGLKLSTSLQ